MIHKIQSNHKVYSFNLNWKEVYSVLSSLTSLFFCALSRIFFKISNKLKFHFFSKYLTAAVLLMNFVLTACAYRLGSQERTLPGGVKTLSVPLFKNKTQEVGIEAPFTNALIQEFERSKIANITSEDLAEAYVEGEIVSISYDPTSYRSDDNMPLGTVLAAEYRILITSKVSLRRLKDKSVLWTGLFNGERTYVAPQVTQGGLNTVNPLYNLSARRQNIEVMAKDMMNEAHDRVTENF